MTLICLTLSYYSRCGSERACKDHKKSINLASSQNKAVNRARTGQCSATGSSRSVRQTDEFTKFTEDQADSSISTLRKTKRALKITQTQRCVQVVKVNGGGENETETLPEYQQAEPSDRVEGRTGVAIFCE